MEKDLIEYEECVDASDVLLMFENCTFKRDIGPIKKGDMFKFVSIYFEDRFYLIAQNDYEDGTIEETEVALTLAYATPQVQNS